MRFYELVRLAEGAGFSLINGKGAVLKAARLKAEKTK